MKNTEENRLKLAREAVANLSMDELVTYAEHCLMEHYRASPDDFEEEWETLMDEEE